MENNETEDSLQDSTRPHFMNISACLLFQLKEGCWKNEDFILFLSEGIVFNDVCSWGVMSLHTHTHIETK